MSFLLPALVLALQTGPQPIFTDGHTATDAQGVWRSADYGWIIEIEEDTLTRWQDTPAGCYRTPDAPTARLMGQIEYRLFTREGDTIGLQYLDGDSNTRFERLPHLPERCGAEDLDTPSGVFEVFASAMQAHYAFFDQRGIDWPARVEAARPLFPLRGLKCDRGRSNPLVASPRVAPRLSETHADEAEGPEV